MNKRGAGLMLLAAFVVAPVAAFAWQSLTADETADEVRVSIDGVRWSADVEDDFFYSDTAWEPGEVRTANVWLRNDATRAADIVVTVTCTAGDQLVPHGALMLSASVDDGPAQSFDADQDVNMVRVGRLERQERATVTLRAELVSDLPEPQVLEAMGIRYQVAGTGHAAESGPSSVLPGGGAHLVLAPVFLAAALILTAVLMATRRRTHEDEDVSDRH